jgi:hypothetical protein
VQPQCANLLIPSLPSHEPRADRFCALTSFDRCVSNGDAVKRAQFPCPLKDCAWGAIGLCPVTSLTRTGDSTGAQRTSYKEAVYPQPSALNPQPSTLNPQSSTLNPQPLTLKQVVLPGRVFGHEPSTIKRPPTSYLCLHLSVSESGAPPPLAVGRPLFMLITLEEI